MLKYQIKNPKIIENQQNELKIYIKEEIDEMSSISPKVENGVFIKKEFIPDDFPQLIQENTDEICSFVKVN